MVAPRASRFLPQARRIVGSGDENAWTLENKNDKIHISSKLNSAFSTIGKATADKISAKLLGKTHAFAFACMNNKNFKIRTRIHVASHVREISNIFCAFR